MSRAHLREVPCETAEPPRRMEPPRLRDYAWLAERLGIPKGTAQAMVHRGQVPVVRLGKRLVRFDEQAIEAWIASRTTPAKGPPNGSGHLPGVGWGAPAPGVSSPATPHVAKLVTLEPSARDPG